MNLIFPDLPELPPRPLQDVVDAVVFDCFGTLLQITRRTDPYRGLWDALPGASRALLRDLVLTQPDSPVQVAQRLGCELSPAQQSGLTSALANEIRSIQPFPDAFPILDALAAGGLRVAVCSNLASPYVEPARRLLAGRVDAFVWSCYFGVAKPSPRIFARACEVLAAAPERVLVIGDSFASDVAGANSLGMPVAWLRRESTAGPTCPGVAAIRTLRELVRA